MLQNILISTILISLLSFVGVLTLIFKKKQLNKITFYLVAFSAGALMGGAFIHLLPEAINTPKLFEMTLIGFIIFYILEKVLYWRHCHKGVCSIHTFSYMNLAGDLIHNFIDGLVIAAAFMANFALGLSTSIAIAMHEIPQELGDFGVLIHGKIPVKKALLLNFLTALTAVLGGIIGFYFGSGWVEYLIPIAAGGFIYIAATDLIPEIRKNDSAVTFAIFLIGVLLMYVTKVILG